jgi:hypothetical protein
MFGLNECLFGASTAGEGMYPSADADADGRESSEYIFDY